MAHVPYSDGVADTSAPTSVPDDYQRIQTNPNMFGGAIAQQVGQTGQKIGDIGQFWGEIQTDSALNTAQSQLSGLVDKFKSLNGADALNQQADFQSQLDQVQADARSQLKTPQQQLQFDNQIRSFRERYVNGQIVSHANQQGREFAVNTNNESYKGALNRLASNADNPELAAVAVGEARTALIKNAHIMLGNSATNDQVHDFIATGMSGVAKTQVEALAVKNPQGAKALADQLKDTLGVEYAPLADRLKGAVATQGAPSNVDGLRNKYLPNGALPSTSGGFQPVAGMSFTPDPATGVSPMARAMLPAIRAQESGGANAVPDSQTGAHGVYQIQPETFQHYARPGENPNSVADQEAVAGRIAQEALTKSGGNPASVPVAYYSGIGNVAPPGSPTPYLRDLSPGAGVAGPSTSGYVQQVMSRFSEQPAPGSAANPVQMAATNIPMATGTSNDAMLAQVSQNSGIPIGQLRAAMLGADATLLSANDKEYGNDPVTHAANEKLIKDQAYQARVAISQYAVQQQTDEKARRDADNDAASEYSSKILADNTNGLMNQMSQDHRLTFQTRDALFNMMVRQAEVSLHGSPDVNGPGYLKAWADILAPAGDPSRISDPAIILRRAGGGGDLTPVGAQKLLNVIREIQRNPDVAGIERTKVGLLNYAKRKLSFQDDSVPYSPRDPKGEQLFDGQFIGQFEKTYAEWIKNNKNPYDFLTKDNMDKMVTELRSPSDMAREKIAATGESVPQGPDATPIPPPPPGVAPSQWQQVMAKPPLGPNGNNYTHEAWRQALSRLLSNNTPEYRKAFDEWFAPSGYRADDILRRFSQKETSEPETPTEPMAVPP